MLKTFKKQCLLCFSCLLQAFILDHKFYLGVDYRYVRYVRFQFAAASYKPTVRVCLRTRSSRSKPYLYQGGGTVCFGPFSSSASSRGSRGMSVGARPPLKSCKLGFFKTTNNCSAMMHTKNATCRFCVRRLCTYRSMCVQVLHFPFKFSTMSRVRSGVKAWKAYP